jgi:hypothetical protein
MWSAVHEAHCGWTDLAGQLVNAVILTLAAAKVDAWDVELRSPALEDAFMALVARDGATRCNYSPLGAASQATQDAISGTFPAAALLGTLAGYAVVFGFLAARYFRWE